MKNYFLKITFQETNVIKKKKDNWSLQHRPSPSTRTKHFMSFCMGSWFLNSLFIYEFLHRTSSSANSMAIWWWQACIWFFMERVLGFYGWLGLVCWWWKRVFCLFFYFWRKRGVSCNSYRVHCWRSIKKFLELLSCQGIICWCDQVTSQCQCGKNSMSKVIYLDFRACLRFLFLTAF